MFARKSARLLNTNGGTEKLLKASDQQKESELICFDPACGLLGQPGAFYVGIGLGIIFQAALVTISIALV